MPRYRIAMRVVEEWWDTFDAPNENAAREMAYAEAEKDIRGDAYVELVVKLLQE